MEPQNTLDDQLIEEDQLRISLVKQQRILLVLSLLTLVFGVVQPFYNLMAQAQLLGNGEAATPAFEMIYAVFMIIMASYFWGMRRALQTNSHAPIEFVKYVWLTTNTRIYRGLVVIALISLVLFFLTQLV